ncbi:hypothetical protein IIC65_09170, partial [Candidatus Sumerlaeota bacterium]|nr:hypothetical protein [Candidatus Sumerlaeota bacterium]
RGRAVPGRAVNEAELRLSRAKQALAGIRQHLAGDDLAEWNAGQSSEDCEAIAARFVGRVAGAAEQKS